VARNPPSAIPAESRIYFLIVTAAPAASRLVPLVATVSPPTRPVRTSKSSPRRPPRLRL